MPRLEIETALNGARMAHYVQESIRVKLKAVTLWIDSVLAYS